MEISVECGVYGEGESENATDEEAQVLTDEFIDKEVDWIADNSFVIIKEDDND